jgi:hypothetical protein
MSGEPRKDSLKYREPVERADVVEVGLDRDVQGLLDSVCGGGGAAAPTLLSASSSSSRSRPTQRTSKASFIFLFGRAERCEGIASSQVKSRLNEEAEGLILSNISILPSDRLKGASKADLQATCRRRRAARRAWGRQTRRSRISHFAELPAPGWTSSPRSPP